MEGCWGVSKIGEAGELQGTGAFEGVCADKLLLLFSHAHPHVCAGVREHADSFLWSNAHSQMKSSNVSARKPQLGSHAS